MLGWSRHDVLTVVVLEVPSLFRIRELDLADSRLLVSTFLVRNAHAKLNEWNQHLSEVAHLTHGPSRVYRSKGGAAQEVGSDFSKYDHRKRLHFKAMVDGELYLLYKLSMARIDGQKNTVFFLILLAYRYLFCQSKDGTVLLCKI